MLKHGAKLNFKNENRCRCENHVQKKTILEKQKTKTVDAKILFGKNNFGKIKNENRCRCENHVRKK